MTTTTLHTGPTFEDLDQLAAMFKRAAPRVRLLRVRTFQVLEEHGVHPSAVQPQKNEHGYTVRVYEGVEVRLNGYLNEGDILVEFTDGSYRLIPAKRRPHAGEAE